MTLHIFFFFVVQIKWKENLKSVFGLNVNKGSFNLEGSQAFLNYLSRVKKYVLSFLLEVSVAVKMQHISCSFSFPIGDLLPVMCERAGFPQETNLILYEVWTDRFFFCNIFVFYMV